MFRQVNSKILSFLSSKKAFLFLKDQKQDDVSKLKKMDQNALKSLKGETKNLNSFRSLRMSKIY